MLPAMNLPCTQEPFPGAKILERFTPNRIIPFVLEIFNGTPPINPPKKCAGCT